MDGDRVPPPEVIDTLRHEPRGASWLTSVGATARRVAERWGLTLGAVLPGGMVSLVVDATTSAGTPVVLKLQYPHRECAHEADALARWDGNGAIRLLDHDRDDHALLLERCEPGRRLSESLTGPLALEVMIDLLERLLVPAGAPFTTLTDECERWVASLTAERGTYFDADLTDLAIEWLGDLAPTQRDAVLVHQDLHGDNVLRAHREPWLAIDPKPLIGEREFAVAPIVRSCELGHSRTEAVDRLDRLSERLGLDRERARRWTVAQTIAWASGSSIAATHLETVRWLLAEG